MRLHLGGHLNFYDPQKRTWLDMTLPGSTSLAEIIRQAGLPEGEVALLVINGQQADMHDLVCDADRVELYPPMGGG